MCRRSRATISGMSGTVPIRSATRGRRSSASSRRAGVDHAGLRIAEPQAGVIVGSGGRRHRRRRTPARLLRRARPQGHAMRSVSIVGMVSSEISISLRLRGISHVLSCGCTELPTPSATRRPDSGQERRVAVGRHGRRHARHDLRLSRMRSCRWRHRRAGGRLAAVRSPPRRLRAGEGAWMVVRARGSGAGARRDDLRLDRRLRIDLRRVTHASDGADGVEIVRAITLAIERSGRRLGRHRYISYHGPRRC